MDDDWRNPFLGAFIAIVVVLAVIGGFALVWHLLGLD